MFLLLYAQAKHAVDQVQHRISLHETYLSDSPAASTMGRLSDPSPLPPAVMRRREAINRDVINEPDASGSSQGKGGRSQTHKNVTKHNSAPLFPARVSSPSDDPPSQGENVSCVIPHHPLSAQAIRVSLETKKDTKFKGSPVTALKNEIDKRFLSNGSETAPLEAAAVGVGSSSGLQGLERETDQKSTRQEMVSSAMIIIIMMIPMITTIVMSGVMIIIMIMVIIMMTIVMSGVTMIITIVMNSVMIMIMIVTMIRTVVVSLLE